MKHAEKTLLEQMQISDFEVEQRKALFSFGSKDVETLKTIKPIIDANLDLLVEKFYEMQTNIPEISLLIGDSDTLARLHRAQRKYIVDLFTGLYDLEYVNNRLRIGLVHKRIGVDPKLYLSAVYTLKYLLYEVLRNEIPQEDKCQCVLNAIEKLLLFDVTLVFDTYIRSLVTEIEIAKQKSDQYARELEHKVKERTEQLEILSRTDPLTGLLNVRHLMDVLVITLRAAQRRSEPVSLMFMDINDFKLINDTEGHQQGDEILRVVGTAIKKVARAEDHCFRYGGDEFCIILPNCKASDAHAIYSSRLKSHIQQRVHNLFLSIGIAQTGPNDYIEPEALLRKADKNMYADKEKSKSNGHH